MDDDKREDIALIILVADHCYEKMKMKLIAVLVTTWLWLVVLGKMILKMIKIIVRMLIVTT
jgi:hypothetical protein